MLETSVPKNIWRSELHMSARQLYVQIVAVAAWRTQNHPGAAACMQQSAKSAEDVYRPAKQPVAIEVQYPTAVTHSCTDLVLA